jgi:predicted alpha/beta-hydrolase family hydrolase
MTTRLKIAVETGVSTTALVYPAERNADAALILGHGAGAGQQSPFMVDFSRGLAARGTDVVTFNFLYIEQGRKTPDRLPRLQACYAAVVETVRAELPSANRRLIIGGKSMGGRIATHLAASDATIPIAGLVLLGYPLHPPGRPDELRDAHLPSVRRPMLFVQGSRDPFGSPVELRPVLARLSPEPALHVIEGGDHSLKPSSRNSDVRAALAADIQQTISDWVRTLQ